MIVRTTYGDCQLIGGMASNGSQSSSQTSGTLGLGSASAVAATVRVPTTASGRDDCEPNAAVPASGVGRDDELVVWSESRLLMSIQR